MTADKVDENVNQFRELKFCKSINLSVYIKIFVIFFISALIRCQRLITAVKAYENENQLRELKFGTEFNFSVQ